MYINPHKIASNYPSKRAHSFTGNGARACSSRRADEVRGFSETGYSYFGARYYDSDLSGLFLSVDPMSDKYPSISPYAYCAWNPIKLVDPNGDTISMNYINSNDDNTRLLNNLSKKTGLSLYLDNGKMAYKKDENGNAIVNGGSDSARKDLIECIIGSFTCDVNIGDYSNVISKGRSTHRKENDVSGSIWLNINGFSERDNPTYDLGMVFLHELQHSYFGKEDDGKTTVFNFGSKYGSFHGGTPGSTVDRINVYRKELSLPTRCSYESNPYEGIYYGKIPFKSNNGNIIWL